MIKRVMASLITLTWSLGLLIRPARLGRRGRQSTQGKRPGHGLGAIGGLLGLLHAAWVRHGGSRPNPGQERGQHPRQELHGLRVRQHSLLPRRICLHVRRRQQLYRHERLRPLAGLASEGLPIWASWMFQAVFCGTAATIVSGVMAERTKFPSYLIATAYC